MANTHSFEQRQKRDEKFIRHYVELGGNATAAAKAIGVSVSSASTTGNRMKKRLWKQIQIEIKSNIKSYMPMAVRMLIELAEGADSERVRLYAVKDLLDRGGLKPTDKQRIEYRSPTSDMTDDEMRSELETFFEQDLAQHLKENDLHLITQEQFELVESILEHPNGNFVAITGRGLARTTH